jgi:hypothetical protein
MGTTLYSSIILGHWSISYLPYPPHPPLYILSSSSGIKSQSQPAGRVSQRRHIHNPVVAQIELRQPIRQSSAPICVHSSHKLKFNSARTRPSGTSSDSKVAPQSMTHRPLSSTSASDLDFAAVANSAVYFFCLLAATAAATAAADAAASAAVPQKLHDSAPLPLPPVDAA